MCESMSGGHHVQAEGNRKYGSGPVVVLQAHAQICGPVSTLEGLAKLLRPRYVVQV